MRRTAAFLLCLLLLASCTGTPQTLADPDLTPGRQARPREKPVYPPPSDPIPVVNPLTDLRSDWVYMYFPDPHAGSLCEDIRMTQFIAIPVKRAIGDTESLLEDVFRAALRRWMWQRFVPKHRDPGSWLRGVRLVRGWAHIDFRPFPPSAMGNASTSCGSGAFQTEVMRMALQFEEVERVVLENQGDCRRWYLFEGKQSCGGIRRSFYERYLGWDELPHVKAHDLDRLRSKGTVVFYRLNPDFSKVDGACGARERSYVIRKVDVPEGSRRYLTEAIRALFERVWDRPGGQIEEVSIAGDTATVGFRSMAGLGFASTACGSNAFIGPLLRTAFQFPNIQRVRIELGGSCKKFGDYMQALRCIIATRKNLG